MIQSLKNSVASRSRFSLLVDEWRRRRNCGYFNLWLYCVNERRGVKFGIGVFPTTSSSLQAHIFEISSFRKETPLCLTAASSFTIYTLIIISLFLCRFTYNFIMRWLVGSQDVKHRLCLWLISIDTPFWPFISFDILEKKCSYSSRFFYFCLFLSRIVLRYPWWPFL